MRKGTALKVKKRGLGRPAGNRPRKGELQLLYVEKKKSIREIAGHLGCSKDRIFRALREYGIERRPHTWRSRLERYDLDFLKETVNKTGYRKGAKELGVDKSTLYRYLKRMGKSAKA
jgi:transcriptional regulator of acetoin/glycerol metabolism